MKFIKGKDRNQTSIFPISIEASIEEDNEVRIIDLFVDSIDLTLYGFKVDFKENGRPAYHPLYILKLFIYGYMNKIRSSRDLEKACKRNIEVIWLLKDLKPDHNTIANFRKENANAIRKVFRATVSMAKNFDLIGAILIAGDSTKLRAQNSKKNNFNQKKIERHLQYIDQKLEHYQKELQDNDAQTSDIEKEMDKHKTRRQQYVNLQKELKQTGQAQISTSDPDSRHMITRNNITEVAYNVQTSVDAKHCIAFDYKVTNVNDGKAMGNMLERATEILQKNNFTALYDKGYHTGSEFQKADDLGVAVMVAIPNAPNQAPDPKYNVANFTYNHSDDTYICPQGKELKSSGKWHKAKTYLFKRYATKDCKSCPVKEKCTKAKYGKAIQRSQYQTLIENNQQHIEKNKEIYRKRQQIVEHPYGTIKRQWGFSYIITKKYINRAEADVGLMFTAYNLRRIINIIGKKRIKELLNDKHLFSLKTNTFISLIKRVLRIENVLNKYNGIIYKLSLNHLILA